MVMVVRIRHEGKVTKTPSSAHEAQPSPKWASTHYATTPASLKSLNLTNNHRSAIISSLNLTETPIAKTHQPQHRFQPASPPKLNREK